MILSFWYHVEKRKTEKEYNEFWVLYIYMNILIYDEEEIQFWETKSISNNEKYLVRHFSIKSYHISFLFSIIKWYLFLPPSPPQSLTLFLIKLKLPNQSKFPKCSQSCRTSIPSISNKRQLRPPQISPSQV